MSKFRVFTQESRDQIIKSITNQSTSKQAWSFSKQKRFIAPPPNCPYVAYANPSTISNKKTVFGSSRRKIFTEISEAPCSWAYRSSPKNDTPSISLGAGRSQVVANSYIERDPLKNPGPGRYVYQQSKRTGYTIRPKTANHRNYFIDDKQQVTIPGPGNYNSTTTHMIGKNLISKYKSTVLGGSLMNKTKRFTMSQTKTPSVFDYKTNQQINLMGQSPGSTIGNQNRPAFTDKVSKSSFTPGPGNYRLPTQFAHYKKMTPYV